MAAQALVAASRTVTDRPVHSLHAYFLRPGDQTIPIVYHVQRIRDGRSFGARRVEAVQHGAVIFNLTASFHDHGNEEGFDHQDDLDEATPDPESVPTFPPRLAEWGIDGVPGAQLRLIDLRPIEFVDPADPRPLPPRRRVWFRATGALPLRSGGPRVRRGLCLGSVPARYGTHPARRAVVLSERVVRQPRSHDVVPSPVPGRRLAAARATYAVGVRGSRLRLRLDLHSDGSLAVTVVQEGVVRRRH